MGFILNIAVTVAENFLERLGLCTKVKIKPLKGV